jgi:hypothetical protein
MNLCAEGVRLRKIWENEFVTKKNAIEDGFSFRPFGFRGFESFEPLALETKVIYDCHAERLPEALTSPLYFQSLYAWNFTSVNRYKIYAGHLCFVAADTKERDIFALPPVGPLDEKNFAAAVSRVFSEFQRAGLPCSFHEVPAFMLPCFFALGGYDVSVDYNPDWSDYVFTQKDFMAGIQKNSSREAMSHFQRHFSPRVHEVSPSDLEPVRALTEKFYCRERRCAECFCGCEMVVLSRMVRDWDQLDMRGLVVESKDGPIAVGTVCFQKDTLLFLSKKVRQRTRGLNEYLNVALMDRFGGRCRYVNYSDDMGSEGLRFYKSRLGRHSFLHRHVVTLGRKGGA